MCDVHLTKQFMELFQMKALVLLERHGIATNTAVRVAVKSTPIHASLDGNALQCTLTQILTLFHGQTVVVSGSSELDPKTRTISRLYPETFSISVESRKTELSRGCRLTALRRIVNKLSAIAGHANRGH